MKTAPLALAFLMATISIHGDATVSVTKEVLDTKAADIEQHAVALLVSCDYEASDNIATEARWQRSLGSPNAHVIFAKARNLRFQFSSRGTAKLQEVAVNEILIPVSAERSPDYILVLCDDRVRAFSKYHDQVALLALQKCVKIPLGADAE